MIRRCSPLALAAAMLIPSASVAAPSPTGHGSTPKSGALCAPPVDLPDLRVSGKLTVHSPVPTRLSPGGKRLRSHTKILSQGRGRVWHGPEVPSFVPLTPGKLELDILDRVPGGYMALYREPFESCGYDSNHPNCQSEVRIFDCAGKTTAVVPLNQYHSRKTHLEVQDARLDGRVLYHNEACITYSRQAGGRCSSLVAVDVPTGKVLWRTRPLTSNNAFLVHGDHIIAGYGFTAEPSAIHVLRKKDGKRLSRTALKTKAFPGGNHDALSIEGSLLRVGVYEEWNDLTFRLLGFDKGKPHLAYAGAVAPPPAPKTDRKRRTPAPRPRRARLLLRTQRRYAARPAVDSNELLKPHLAHLVATGALRHLDADQHARAVGHELRKVVVDERRLGRRARRARPRNQTTDVS